jgi:hypothetical protein
VTDPCAEYTVFGSLIVNQGDGTVDRLWTGETENAITGLDGRPLRQQVDLGGQFSGVHLQDAYWDAREIVFQGIVQIVTADYWEDISGYREALMDLEAAWVSAWDSALDTTFNLTFTPAGQSGQSIAVKLFNPPLQFGGTLFEPTFTFGLISATG